MVRTPTIVGIIQARMGSSRLPGKILAPIVAAKPLLAVLVERIRPTGIPLWLATTTEHSDDVTAVWGEELGLHVLRGSREDVLSRFADVCAATEPDWVVRFTADDPFTDFAITREVISFASTVDSGVDLITSGPQFPLGYVPQAARGSAIIRLNKTQRAIPNKHREHVTTALVPTSMPLRHIPELPERPKLRWTVDKERDLDMTRTVFSGLQGAGVTHAYTSIVDWLDQHPEVATLNLPHDD